MSQTNTEQCQDASRGEPSHGGSRSTYCGDCNDNHGKSLFVNSSLVKQLTKNGISNLSIVNGGPWSIQPKKVLEGISAISQGKHYAFIPDIIIINTKPTQDYFLSNRPIKRQPLSKHHVKVGFVGIQTAALLVTLWISYGHPAHIKHAGYLFEFHLSITLAVI